MKDDHQRKCLAIRPTAHSVQRSPWGIDCPSSEGSCFKLCMRSVQGKPLEMPYEDTILMVKSQNRRKVQGVASMKIRVTLHVRRCIKARLRRAKHSCARRAVRQGERGLLRRPSFFRLFHPRRRRARAKGARRAVSKNRPDRKISPPASAEK
jgi:hypothetical protein